MSADHTHVFKWTYCHQAECFCGEMLADEYLLGLLPELYNNSILDDTLDDLLEELIYAAKDTVVAQEWGDGVHSAEKRLEDARVAVLRYKQGQKP